MDYPFKKVLETRILVSSSFDDMNAQLLKLQADNGKMNGSCWEPHGNLVVLAHNFYSLTMNRYSVVTY